MAGGADCAGAIGIQKVEERDLAVLAHEGSASDRAAVGQLACECERAIGLHGEAGVTVAAGPDRAADAAIESCGVVGGIRSGRIVQRGRLAEQPRIAPGEGLLRGAEGMHEREHGTLFDGEDFDVGGEQRFFGTLSYYE